MCRSSETAMLMTERRIPGTFVLNRGRMVNKEWPSLTVYTMAVPSAEPEAAKSNSVAIDTQVTASSCPDKEKQIHNLGNCHEKKTFNLVNNGHDTKLRLGSTCKDVER